MPLLQSGARAWVGPPRSACACLRPRPTSGPGFDALGLALGLYDDIEVSVAPHGVTVEVDGEGAGRVPCDDAHLVVRAMRTTWAITGDAPSGLRMRCRNAIPHSRGLGSSAAAAVGGAVAAVVLAGRDAELERDTILQVTAGMEGHADNAAASLLGGFVVAWETPGNTAERFHAVRLDAHPDIRPVAFIAGAESLTSTTRGCCPSGCRWSTRPSPAAAPHFRCWPSPNVPSC